MNRVFLRALSLDDLDFTNKWHSDEKLYQTLVGPFRYVSKDAEKEWLQNKSKYSTQEINLIICLQENSQPIGLISVRVIDWFSKNGHLSGIMIGESELRGKGYGVEALGLMVDHCFKDLGLNRLWAQVLEENDASRKVFEKCGFNVEGKLRQHTFKNGKFCNVLVLGICADQYFLSDKN